MTQDPAPQHFAGYRLLQRLGTGGTGTVWEALDQADNRVALKRLHPSQADSEQARQRIVRESTLVNHIPGHGIARVVDFEAEDDSPFIVTELIEGPTLAETIAEYPLTQDECLLLATQLQDILGRVHGAGIIHRDLKPSNIILSDDGPVLIDFGIAQHEDDARLTQTGKITGTPGFVSPELLAGDRDYSFQQWVGGDWWAWSALLLNCLTGRPPFGQGNLHGVMHRIFQGQPDVAGLPEPLQLMFTRALSADPTVRPSPEAVIESLAVVRVHEPPTDVLPAGPQQTWVMPAAPVEPRLTEPTYEWMAEPGYEGRRLPSTHLTILALFALLSLLPASVGWEGLVLPLAILVGLSVFGACYAWRESRRVSAASVRTNDTFIASLFLPRHLWVGIIQLVPGLALGALLAMVSQAVGLQVFGLTDTITLIDIPGWLALEGPPPLTWVVIMVGLLTTYVTPTSRTLRLGGRAVFSKLLPSAPLRVILALVGIVIVGVFFWSFRQ